MALALIWAAALGVSVRNLAEVSDGGIRRPIDYHPELDHSDGPPRPASWLVDFQDGLTARLRDHVGGRDGRDSILPILRDQTRVRLGVPQPQLPNKEVLDVSDTVLVLGRGWWARHNWTLLADDTPLLLARQAAGQEAAERAEELGSEPNYLADTGRRTRDTTSSSASSAVLEPEVGDEWARITHYFGARVPFGDGGGYNNPMGCYGEMPDAGAAACAREYCGREFTIAGVGLRCADTGGAVALRNIDVFCVSLECWDWACTQPCPAFADWETVRWLP